MASAPNRRWIPSRARIDRDADIHPLAQHLGRNQSAILPSSRPRYFFAYKTRRSRTIASCG